MELRLLRYFLTVAKEQSLEKDFRNCRLLLPVILEPMPESWQQMDWDIRYRSKVLQSIGERIFLYSEEFLLKSRQAL